MSALQTGRALVREALRFLELEPETGALDPTPSGSRVALLQNPVDPGARPSALQQLVLATLALPTRRPKIAGESREDGRYRMLLPEGYVLSWGSQHCHI